MYGTTFLNPLLIIPKGDSIKCARDLNSNTEQSHESWPIEPLAPQLARANKKYQCAIDLLYAYAYTPLDRETLKLTPETNSLLLYEAFMVSKDTRISLKNICQHSLKLLMIKVLLLFT